MILVYSMCHYDTEAMDVYVKLENTTDLCSSVCTGAVWFFMNDML